MLFGSQAVEINPGPANLVLQTQPRGLDPEFYQAKIVLHS